jgi:branched-chain amino acid aminotransferase
MPSSLDVEGGPRVAPVAVDAPPSLPPNAAKPADRTFWALAQGRASGLEVEQAVLIDPSGYVIDGSTASVWAVFGTKLVTPSSPPAIHGVGRMVIEELAPKLGFTVESRAFDYDELVRADEAMLSNATGGAVAVRHRGGPISAALAHEFRQLYAGEDD